MPIGTLGMYFFLASEAMFFVGLLGSFVVLESAGGQREVFAESAKLLSRSAGTISVVILILSSVLLKPRPIFSLFLGIAFVLWQCFQWHHLLAAHSGPSRNNFFACCFLFTAVHITHLVAGLIALLGFICKSTPVSELVRRAGFFGFVTHRSGFSEYLRDRLGKDLIPRPLQIYWHFVNIVGVLGLAVLYFV